MKIAPSDDDEDEMEDGEWWFVSQEERREAEEALYQQIHYSRADETKAGKSHAPDSCDDLIIHVRSSPSPAEEETAGEIGENGVVARRKGAAHQDISPVGWLSISSDDSDSSVECLGTWAKEDDGEVVDFVGSTSSPEWLSSDSAVLVDPDSQASASSPGNGPGNGGDDRSGRGPPKCMSKEEWRTEAAARVKAHMMTRLDGSRTEEVPGDGEDYDGPQHRSKDRRIPERSGANENRNRNTLLNDLPESYNQPARQPFNVTKRYFTIPDPQDSQVKCHNCFDIGHSTTNCMEPIRVPVCVLCGVEGHTDNACPGQLCFNCDCPGHRTRECMEQRQNVHAMCFRCGMHGHIRRFCPDLWRQYHLTEEAGGMVFTDTPVIPHEKMYCYNCGVKGHLGHVCKEPRMELNKNVKVRLPSIPTVCTYDKPTQYVQLPPGALPVEKAKENNITEPLQVILRPGKKRDVSHSFPCDSGNKADEPTTKKARVQMMADGDSSLPPLSRQRNKHTRFGKDLVGVSSASFGIEDFHSDQIDLFQGNMAKIVRFRDENVNKWRSKQKVHPVNDNSVGANGQCDEQIPSTLTRKERRQLKKERKKLKKVKLSRGDDHGTKANNGRKGQDNIDRIAMDAVDQSSAGNPGLNRHSRGSDRQNGIVGSDPSVDSHNAGWIEGKFNKCHSEYGQIRNKRGFHFNPKFRRFHWKKPTT